MPRHGDSSNRGGRGGIFRTKEKHNNTPDSWTSNGREENGLLDGYPNQQDKGGLSSFLQIRASLIANAAVIHPGMMFAFSSVALPQLEAPDSPIPVTPEQASWIASVASFATPAGCLLGGLLMDRVGRRTSLALLAIPCVLGWSTLGAAGLLASGGHISAESALLLIYSARVLKGLGTGIVAGVSRVYTSEVTSPRLRGSLCSLASLGVSTGVLLGYALGAAFSWPVMALLAGLVPLTTGTLALTVLPETPTWLLQQGRHQDARRSLAALRHPLTPSLQLEQELSSLGGATDSCKMSKLQILTEPSTLKPLALVVFYFLCYQFSGISVLTFYNLHIVRHSGVDVDGYAMAVGFGVIRLICTIIGVLILRLVDRRWLTLLSGTLSGAAMLSLGLHGFLSRGEDMTHAPWIWRYFPLACITSFYITYSLGCLLIPWVLMGEIYPARVRGFLSGVTSCFAHTFLFAAVKSFPVFLERLQFHGTFWLYGSVIALGTVTLFILLPETRGRTLLEIEGFFKPKPRKEAS